MVTTILVPLDGSPLAERALPAATALARVLEGRLMLLRVTATPRLGDWPEAEAEAATYLAEVAGRLEAEGLTVETRLHHVYHMFYEGIVRAILNEADQAGDALIVMSTHGRGGLGRWLFGSIADEILRQAEVPVLMVPATAKQTLPTDRPPRILVPLDGSPLAEEGLDRAGQLTEQLGAELHLLQVVEPPHYGYAEAFPMIF